MIDYNEVRTAVTSGLSEYLGCTVIRSNQNAAPPDYPFVSYTITTSASENNGTYEEWSDGTTRKLIKQTWSITALSNEADESVELAIKAREWLEYAGRKYLSDNGVIVRSVTSITNRDNILSVEYEYKQGFDVVFYLFENVENSINTTGTIEAENIILGGEVTSDI